MPAHADDARVPLIMTGLPPSGSAAYAAIKAHARNVAVQPLSLTSAEAWTVAKEGIEALRKAAAAQGVEVISLPADWNHIFVSAPAGAVMTAEQRAMLARAVSSPAATQVAAFLPPRAAVVEYALTRVGPGPPSG